MIVCMSVTWPTLLEAVGQCVQRQLCVDVESGSEQFKGTAKEWDGCDLAGGVGWPAFIFPPLFLLACFCPTCTHTVSCVRLVGGL